MPELVPRTLALRLSHGDAFFIHQVAVDAYAAQHAGPASKTITIAFALIGLCLLLERGYTGKAVQRAQCASPTDRSVGLRLTRRHIEEVSPSQTFSVPCRAARGTRQLCSGQHRCGRLGSRRIRLSAHSSPGTRNDNGITQAAFSRRGIFGTSTSSDTWPGENPDVLSPRGSQGHPQLDLPLAARKVHIPDGCGESHSELEDLRRSRAADDSMITSIPPS